MKTVAIIGGGPAGMLAAGTVARNGMKVFLIDKNKNLGKKLRITGKGRCNITNNADISDFFSQIPVNHKFLYSALYSFTNEDIIRLIEEQGVKTKVERGGRVFPESDNAHDVADALKHYALVQNVIWIRDTVTKIDIKNGKIVGVKLNKRELKCEAVILATGGMSYPLTGSDGSGYRLAEMLGHSIVKPTPSLIPIVTKEKWVSELSGLTLKNVELSAYNKNGRKIYSDFGEMIFTHFGISGPIVLSASAHLKAYEREQYRLRIDLKPALSEEQLDARIIRDFDKNKKKNLSNGLGELLPKALISVIIELSGIEPDKEISFVTKEERTKLMNIIKGVPLSIEGFRPLEEAIVTSGGIKVSEINPSTMESKLIDGLYFAGEIIDVDAYTGGYNLQIAWSTAHLAAEACSLNL